MESPQALYANYSATSSSNKLKQQEEIETRITDWASQHPVFEKSYEDPNNKEIITAFYKARMDNDPDSLYKAGKYCRDHPELKWDVQAIFFFHDSIEQRYLTKQVDPNTEQKIQAAQDNLDNMLVEGRGISEFDPKSIDRKVRDYCLERLNDIERHQPGLKAADARYQLMTWYLCKSDFVTAVNYFSWTAKSGSQTGQFGLRELISLLDGNPPSMKDWSEEKLMSHLYKRADRITYSQSDEYAAIWSDGNRLSIYKKYLELVSEQNYAPAELKLLKLNAKEDAHSAFLLSELFHDGNPRLGLKPDQFESQKYLDMAAQKNHIAAMKKYLTLWRGDKLLPEFKDIMKCYKYEDQIKEDEDYIEKALKDLDDYESGRVKAPEY